MKGLNLFLMLSVLLIFLSCSETHFKEDKIFAGGILVAAKDLNAGKTIYTEYCMACHGVNGDGNGFSAKGLSVPPRNFKLGQYKFGKVLSGELPHDQDFFDILKKGLHGTAMLPWDLTDKQMFLVVQYIKTFAPEKWEGVDKKLGTAIVLGKDPYGEAHKQSAILRGKEIFHIGAQCWSCHRAYVSHSELSQMSKKINGSPITDFDSEMYHVKIQPSDYGYSSMPPEYTYDEVRSAETVEELYIRLNAGVGGTAMASWKDVLQDDEIWAVAHYVKSLMDLKRTPERKILLDEIEKANKL